MWIRSQSDPGGEAAHPDSLDVGHGARAADGRDVSLVAVAEGLRLLAAQARLDHLGRVAPLLHGDRRDPEQLLRLAVLAEHPDHVAEREHLGMARQGQLGPHRDAPGPIDVGSRRLSQLAGERGRGHAGRPDHRAGRDALLPVFAAVLDRDAVVVDVDHRVAEQWGDAEMLERARRLVRERRRKAGEQPIDRLDEQDPALAWDRSRGSPAAACRGRAPRSGRPSRPRSARRRPRRR